MEKQNRDLTRREFLKETAVAGAGIAALGGLVPSKVLGANDRIRLALLGCGGRGSYDMTVFLGNPEEIPSYRKPLALRIRVAPIEFGHSPPKPSMEPTLPRRQSLPPLQQSPSEILAASGRGSVFPSVFLLMGVFLIDAWLCQPTRLRIIPQVGAIAYTIFLRGAWHAPSLLPGRTAFVSQVQTA